MNRSGRHRGLGLLWTLIPAVLAVVLGLAVGCNEPSHPNQAEIDKLHAQPVSYPFSFALMGDSRTPGASIFSEIRSQIQSLSPAPRFAIDNGDLVLTGAPSEYAGYVGYIQGYPIPFLSVIGNHEMYFPGGQAAYGQIFGAEDSYFDYGNIRVIYMNDAVVGGYGLTDAQLAWLDALLAPATPPDKFVLMHVPPTLPAVASRASAPAAAANVPGDDQYTPTAGGVLAGIAAFPNWSELIAMLEARGVRVACFSHNHIYQHTYHANVHYLVTGGAGAEMDTPRDNPPDSGVFHHFLVVTINADGNSKVELIKEGAGTTPDDRYGFSLDTTPVS